MLIVKINKKGTKNIENIIIAFVYNFQFPVLLILFSLKYKLTLLFKVLKNFALSTFENLSVFIKIANKVQK